MKKHIFSLPFCSEAPKDFVFGKYIPFLNRYKEYIYDIYFTSLIPPFVDDGMGAKLGVKDSFKASMKTFEFMMDIQKRFDIRVSATFNSIKVDPTRENLEIFIKNLKPLYARGLRSITIPHYHWMASGRLKQEFPDMFVKNTILRRVSRAQNYVDNCEVGFDLVNIDRYNLRDRDNLKKLKRAYDKKKVPMSILVNEGCRGACPAMDEHFELNCSSEVNELYFTQDLAQNTCNLWKRMNPSYRLQSGLMPTHRDDFLEILEFVQVLKLHGRTVLSVLESSMDIVKRYADGAEFILPGLQKQFEMFNYEPKTLNQWRERIKNCKYDCWECDMCDKLHQSARVEELVF